MDNRTLVKVKTIATTTVRRSRFFSTTVEPAIAPPPAPPNMSESPLGAGGPTSGSETIRNVLDGRFWDISIKGEGPEGPFTGKGIITYQDSFAGQSYMRYEITRGIALLKSGNLGCDLGGTCSLYFETPPFEHNGSRIQLKGRYYLTSPFSYRVTTEIAVDKGEYRNWGTTWYTKNEKAKPAAIK